MGTHFKPRNPRLPARTGATHRRKAAQEGAVCLLDQCSMLLLWKVSRISHCNMKDSHHLDTLSALLIFKNPPLLGHCGKLIHLWAQTTTTQCNDLVSKTAHPLRADMTICNGLQPKPHFGHHRRLSIQPPLKPPSVRPILSRNLNLLSKTTSCLIGPLSKQLYYQNSKPTKVWHSNSQPAPFVPTQSKIKMPCRCITGPNIHRPSASRTPGHQ
jgi:hypothetical protein